MAELYEQRQVTARRPHKCHLCGQKIPPGVWYIREKWKDDGFHEIHRHIHCDALLDEFFKSAHYGNGYEYTEDEVWEWIRDEKCGTLCRTEERDDCDANPFACPRVIQSIANINSRRAAEESLRDSEE